MAKPIIYGKVGLDQYIAASLTTLGTKLGITIPIRTEGWFALRQTVENAAKQISTATGTTVSFDTSSPSALALSVAVVFPNLLSGGTVPANALTYNGDVLTYNGDILTYGV